MEHNRLKLKCPKTFFSDNCIQNIFATIRLRSFSSNIDGNEVNTKKIDRIFKKINPHSPFAWPINYFAIGNLLCDQIIFQKNVSENKNHDVNENFKATVKVVAYIFLRWYLQKKNWKHKYDDVKVKSLKWRATLGLLLKPGPRPWKTWTLRNLDPEKPGI